MATTDTARPPAGERPRTSEAAAPPHPADMDSFGELGPVLVICFLVWIAITVAVGVVI